MSDLISRKAILKHIEKIRQGVQMMDDTHRASIVMTGMHLCEKAVRNQPSVQPEIIRCKDCKYGSPNEVYGCRLEPFSTHDRDSRMYADDFCSRAERRGEQDG